MTTHTARHTFATTVTLTNGISLEALSKMMGHKTTRTTHVYAQIVSSKIANEMEGILAKIDKYKVGNSVGVGTCKGKRNGCLQYCGGC